MVKTYVCIKRVPDTSEAEIRVEASGKEVDSSRFVYGINDADNYAVEEAVLINEALGGTVKYLSIGSADTDVIIRMALAKGGVSGVRIDDPRINVKDPLQVAKVLAAAIRRDEFDLVLTGCMSSDDSNMAVGVALAEELGIPHAAMVKKVVVEEGSVCVHRELEGGLCEVVRLSLPAVLTIQTGINVPRYSPMRGIMAAQKKELKVLSLDDLNVDESAVSTAGSLVEMQSMYIPALVANAEIIEGEPEEKAETIVAKLVKGGLC